MSKKINIPLVGGFLAGIAASACCVGPLFLLMLGFGGAWVSHLTALAPYRPIFIGIALIALFMAYQKIYQANCEEEGACTQSKDNPLYKMLFMGVMVIVFLSIISPYLLLQIYG